MSTIYSVIRPPSVGGIAELVRGGVEHSTGGHPPHWHEQWQLVAVTRGGGWVRVGGTRHHTPGGSLFLIPPEVVHSNDVFEKGCDFRSMLIDAEAVEGIAQAAGLKLARHRISREPVLISPAAARRFDRFHRWLEASHPSLELEEHLDGWITDLLGQQTGQNVVARQRVVHPAAQRARELLGDRAGENLSLEGLAREVALSRYELSRQFKAAFGMPPHAWQLQVRVGRAKDLLKCGVPAGEAALRLGFSDQAHFTRVFRRATGYPPGQMQREFRKIVQDRTITVGDARA